MQFVSQNASLGSNPWLGEGKETAHSENFALSGRRPKRPTLPHDFRHDMREGPCCRMAAAPCLIGFLARTVVDLTICREVAVWLAELAKVLGADMPDLMRLVRSTLWCLGHNLIFLKAQPAAGQLPCSDPAARSTSPASLQIASFFEGHIKQSPTARDAPRFVPVRLQRRRSPLIEATPRPENERRGRATGSRAQAATDHSGNRPVTGPLIIAPCPAPLSPKLLRHMHRSDRQGLIRSLCEPRASSAKPRRPIRTPPISDR